MSRRSLSLVGEADIDTEALEAELADSPFIGLNGVTLTLRVGLVALAAVLAVTVPNFGFLVALMGAVTTMLVSFILPTAFYMMVHWSQISRLQTALCSGIILLGLVGMGIGLYDTLFEGV